MQSEKIEGERRYMRRIEAARYLGLPVATLQYMAKRKQGPPFFKAGPRTVLYRIDQLDQWLTPVSREPSK